jgi:hypothetical protein
LNCFNFFRKKECVFSILLSIVSFNGDAAPHIFECRGAKISADVPDYIEFSRADGGECVFWRRGDNPDYSGYYFGGALRIGSDGSKKAFDFQSSTDPNAGTWESLKSKEIAALSESKSRYMRIDQGNYRIKFLSPVSELEQLEKVEDITRIEGTVSEKGVWVHLSFAIPYKSLTRTKSIEIIDSVKVLRGFSGTRDVGVGE